MHQQNRASLDEIPFPVEDPFFAEISSAQRPRRPTSSPCRWRRHGADRTRSPTRAWLVLSLALGASLLGGATIPARPPSPQPPRLIDDFDDLDIEAPVGLSWVVVSDAQMGGSTATRLKVVEAGSGGALRLETTLGDESPAFAGVWLPVRSDGQAADLSVYRALRVIARGSGNFAVGFRVASAQINFLAPVPLQSEWSTVTVPFQRLVPVPPDPDATFSARDASYFGISTFGPQDEPAWIELDRLELTTVAGEAG